VLTEKGLLPIEEVQIGDMVYTQSGKAPVTELYEMPSRPLIRISVDGGSELTATPSQMLKVLGKDMAYHWKEAKDIAPGDNVVLRLEYPELAKIRLPDYQGREVYLDEDVAYLMGQFLSDGWFEEYHGRFCFFSNEPRVMERVQECLIRAFGHEAKIEGTTYEAEGVNGYYESSKQQVRIHRKELNQYLQGIFGVDSTWKAPTKRIPELFFRSPRSVLLALMEGLIDGDGSVHANRNVITYSTVSKQMSNDLQTLLRQLGIMTTSYVQRAEGRDPHIINGHLARSNFDIYNIEAKGRFAKLLANQLNVGNADKQERIVRLRTAKNDASHFEQIPYAADLAFGELSRRHIGSGWYLDTEGTKFRSGIKLPTGAKIRYCAELKETNLGRGQLVDWGIQSKLTRIGSPAAQFFQDVLDHNLYFAKVERVEEAPAEKTYDMQVAGAHEFVANGVLAHNCLGKYHPHGDSSVYDALVRMAQPFSLRYTMVDGQGNFGSVDGDSAAAMRYTECRLSKIAEEMLQDIDMETVDFVDNFDGSLKEPSVLPSKLPNLLINGSTGIAVGMATEMPPHNLGEVVDAVVHMLDHPDAEAPDLMQFIKGPDFPTGGIIHGMMGIVEAYQTGRGKIRVRAKYKIEDADNRQRIVVSEIPYTVNKSKLIESIADLVKDKRVEGIVDLRDESDRDGMRIVIEVRRDVMPELIMNQLFTHTQMQTTFGVINIALVNNEPKVLSLREILQHHIAYRQQVVRRRTEYELKEARRREHILIALMKAVDALDETLAIIRSAKDGEEARNGLMARFEIDEEQAKAILDMKLQKLTGLEIEGLKQEFAELEAKIKDLLDILAREERIRAIIKEEALYLKQKYGDARRTEIVADEGDLDIEDLIPNEDMVVMVTQDGYIKRVPLDTYKQQRRGGQGLIGMETKEEDFITDMFVTLTHNLLLFFTNKGKVYCIKAWQLPVGSRHAKGKPIINLLPKMDAGEKVMATMPMKTDEKGFLVFATRNGIVKRTELEEYSHIRSCGLIAVGLEEGDDLIDVRLTDGTKDIMLATAKGRCARFEEAQVRPMGRPAHGVIGIRPEEGDSVVSMAIVTKDSKVLTITHKGLGKVSEVERKTPPAEGEEAEVIDEEEEGPVRGYPRKNRGVKGVRAMRLEEGDSLVQLMEVDPDDDLVVATKKGIIMRTPVRDIRVIGRLTYGVRIKGVDEKDRIIAVAHLAGAKAEQMVESTQAHGELEQRRSEEPEE
jgi:DNA gyrase subunit A